MQAIPMLCQVILRIISVHVRTIKTCKLNMAPSGGEQNPQCAELVACHGTNIASDR